MAPDDSIAPGAGAAAGPAPDPNRWLALACVLTATFMILLDVSIVIVAIPPIQHNLGATSSQVQLVLAGYQLAYAVMLITGGRLGDIFGRKRIFMVGMGGFVIASALCGLAPNPAVLVTARIVQGLGAALMYPQVLSVIQVSFAPSERNKAFGIFGGVIGIATITGPLAGGLIVRDDVMGGSWRWIFLVNVPIGLASLLIAFRFLRESRAPYASQLDVPGVLLVSAGLGLLVYPLVEGRQLGWPAWSFVCLALSPVVLAVFVMYERSRQGEKSPLLQLSLFSNRSFSAGVLLSGVFFAGIPAFFFIFSLTLQNGLGFTALHAGLTTVPFAFGSALASAMSVRLAPRLGRVILLIGFGLLIIGMAAVMVALHHSAETVSSLELLPALFISGVGLGAVVAPLLTIILAGVSGREAGSASGLLTSTQQVGGAIGVAIIGVIFFGLLGSRASSIAGEVSPQLRGHVAAVVREDRPATSSANADRVASGVVARFRNCFVDRANAVDPTTSPASCASPSGPVDTRVTSSVSASSRVALGRNFTGALERALIFNVVVWGGSLLLVFGLPRMVREAARGGAA